MLHQLPPELFFSICSYFIGEIDFLDQHQNKVKTHKGYKINYSPTTTINHSSNNNNNETLLTIEHFLPLIQLNKTCKEIRNNIYYNEALWSFILFSLPDIFNYNINEKDENGSYYYSNKYFTIFKRQLILTLQFLNQLCEYKNVVKRISLKLDLFLFKKEEDPKMDNKSTVNYFYNEVWKYDENKFNFLNNFLLNNFPNLMELHILQKDASYQFNKFEYPFNSLQNFKNLKYLILDTRKLLFQNIIKNHCNSLEEITLLNIPNDFTNIPIYLKYLFNEDNLYLAKSLQYIKLINAIDYNEINKLIKYCKVYEDQVDLLSKFKFSQILKSETNKSFPKLELFTKFVTNLTISSFMGNEEIKLKGEYPNLKILNIKSSLQNLKLKNFFADNLESITLQNINLILDYNKNKENIFPNLKNIVIDGCTNFEINFWLSHYNLESFTLFNQPSKINILENLKFTNFNNLKKLTLMFCDCIEITNCLKLQYVHLINCNIVKIYNQNYIYELKIENSNIFQNIGLNVDLQKCYKLCLTNVNFLENENKFNILELNNLICNLPVSPFILNDVKYLNINNIEINYKNNHLIKNIFDILIEFKYLNNLKIKYFNLINKLEWETILTKKENLQLMIDDILNNNDFNNLQFNSNYISKIKYFCKNENDNIVLQCPNITELNFNLTIKNLNTFKNLQILNLNNCDFNNNIQLPLLKELNLIYCKDCSIYLKNFPIIERVNIDCKTLDLIIDNLIEFNYLTYFKLKMNSSTVLNFNFKLKAKNLLYFELIYNNNDKKMKYKVELLDISNLIYLNIELPFYSNISNAMITDEMMTDDKSKNNNEQKDKNNDSNRSDYTRLSNNNNTNNFEQQKKCFIQ